MMKFDLCIGDNEVFWEFGDVADRDKVWTDLTASYGWQLEWADKRGDGSGARCHIVLHPNKMPISYRWKCKFMIRTLSEAIERDPEFTTIKLVSTTQTGYDE